MSLSFTAVFYYILHHFPTCTVLIFASVIFSYLYCVSLLKGIQKPLSHSLPTNYCLIVIVGTLKDCMVKVWLSLSQRYQWEETLESAAVLSLSFLNNFHVHLDS